MYSKLYFSIQYYYTLYFKSYQVFFAIFFEFCRFFRYYDNFRAQKTEILTITAACDIIFIEIIFDKENIFMNQTQKDIIERRSCRRFRPDAVAKESIERIIQAGLFAASGRGRQCPIIVAVTDKETRDRLSRVNAEIMSSVGDPFYGAPAVLVVLAPKDVPTHVYDGSLVMGNLMLAAHTEGLGSCWIHRARETFEREEWKSWLAELGVEGEYEGIGNCVVGYVDGDYPAVIPRKDGRVFLVE